MKVSFFHCSIIFFLEFCIADGHPLNPRRGQKYWRNHRWAFDRNSFAVNSNRDFVLFVSLNLSCRNFFFSRELLANNSCIIMGFGSCNRCCWPTLHWTISVLTSEDFDNFWGCSNFRHQLDCHVETLWLVVEARSMSDAWLLESISQWQFPDDFLLRYQQISWTCDILSKLSLVIGRGWQSWRRVWWSCWWRSWGWRRRRWRRRTPPSWTNTQKATWLGWFYNRKPTP